MERWIADRRYFLTADRGTAVPEDDPRGAFLLIGPGGELTDAEARKYGLIREAGNESPESEGGKNVSPPPGSQGEQPAQSGPVSITRDPESGGKVFTLGNPSGAGTTDQGSSYDLPRPETPAPQSESGITPAANAGSDTTSPTPSDGTQTVTMQNEKMQTASTGQTTAGKAESAPAENKAETGPGATKGKGKNGQSGQKNS